MAIARDKSMQLGELDRPGNLPSRVASLISTEIAENRLKPGDRLPTEQELAEMLGVSRNVVREAIARLRSDGVVHSRQGAGVFVETQAQSILRINPKELEDQAAFRKLFELRRILECEAAALAAERRTETEMEAITAALERLRQPGLQIEADIAFHRAVARATDNNYITTFVNFISEQVRTSIAIAQEKLDPAVNARILSTEHGAIHDAILTRRPSLARAAMRRHISNAAARLGLKP